MFHAAPSFWGLTASGDLDFHTPLTGGFRISNTEGRATERNRHKVLKNDTTNKVVAEDLPVKSPLSHRRGLFCGWI